MSNQEHLDLLKQGVEAWNAWRKQYPKIRPELEQADLSEANLQRADLRGANLRGANLQRADLRQADLQGDSPLDFWQDQADLHEADLRGANLRGANLSGEILNAYVFREAILGTIDLRGTILRRVNFGYLRDLRGINLSDTDLRFATFKDTDLRGADLSRADLRGAEFRLAYPSGDEFLPSDLQGINLSGANLSGADLRGINLSGADLSGADLSGAILIETNMRKATLTGCLIYGISAWNIELEGAIQDSLVITRQSEPTITVDNLEVAQFIYLLLNNQKIRDVINTIGQKGVLILGRFSQERKPVLDALREKLRILNFLPIVFDFDCPTERDFTETIMTLAGLSCFIVADITNPKSSPLELQATVPNYMIPFVPIIQAGEKPFAMFKDLGRKYNWVLDALEYDTPSNLIKGLEKAVVKPALEKRDELLANKVEQLRTRHIGEYL